MKFLVEWTALIIVTLIIVTVAPLIQVSDVCVCGVTCVYVCGVWCSMRVCGAPGMHVCVWCSMCGVV